MSDGGDPYLFVKGISPYIKGKYEITFGCYLTPEEIADMHLRMDSTGQVYAQFGPRLRQLP